MMKLIALVTAGMFAAGTMFAGEHGECTKKVGNAAKAPCSVSFAKMDITPAQKTKLDAAMAEHEKGGCNEASEAKYKNEVKGILSKQQYAKFEAECKKDEKKGETKT